MPSEARAVRRPSDASRRFERWLELIPWCQREEAGVPLARAAERFGESEDGILRDVEKLAEREYYLPGGFADSLTILIERERLRLASPGHFERPVRFSPLEALAMQLGLQIVMAEASADERAELEATSRELAVQLSPVSTSHGAASVWELANPDDDSPVAYGPPLSNVSAEVYAELRRAVREGRAVEMRYFKPHAPDDAPMRRVAPWALAAVHGHWYLLGRESGGTDPKLFRLDRILEARTTEDRAEVAANLRVTEYIDPAGVYRGAEDDLEVAIRYSPRIARWIEEHYTDRAQRQSDGSLVVRMLCKSPWWALTRALAYGADAEILGPTPVRSLMVSLTKEPLG